jgi:hypothetical protein
LEYEVGDGKRKGKNGEKKGEVGKGNYKNEIKNYGI